MALLLIITSVACKKETIAEDEAIISSFTPNKGPTGTEVRITGANFGTNPGAISVRFGEVAAVVSSVTPDKIVTRVPANAHTEKIYISVKGRVAVGQEDFEVTDPTITGLNPSSGTIGSLLTLTGKHLNLTAGAFVIKVAGVTAEVESISEGQVVVRVPAGASTGEVTLVSNGRTLNAGRFTVLTRWTPAADFPGTERSSAVTFSIGNKVYAGLGITFNNFDNYNRTLQSDFWEYDPITKVWAKKADFPGGGRLSAFGFSIGSKGYVGLGVDQLSYPENTPQTDFWEYDPATDSWTRKANFPGAGRLQGVGFSIGHMGYVGLGISTESPFTLEKDFWAYDPLTDAWSQKTDLPALGRYSPVGFSIGDRGYVGTGATRDSGTAMDDFWEYDPQTDT
jgi:hypothetical protein